MTIPETSVAAGILLERLAALARQAEAQEIALEAEALGERLRQGRFYVACVGQFKRGKSTLLNALASTTLLPTGVVPVTSVPTVLRFGKEAARVRLGSGEWVTTEPGGLGEFVSEEQNPGNRLGVLAVELFVPSPLLATGLCLVDTPGLGSVSRANTQATQAFIPHIDAALVVLGADPPISGEELALVAEIAAEVSCFLFVLNKADRVSQPELAAAATFTRQVLEARLKQPIASLFVVSARERQEGQETRDWPALVQQLEQLATDASPALLGSAVVRGARRLAERLDHFLGEEEAALRQPLEQSEARLQVLKKAASAAEHALRELSPLFGAEEQRLAQTFRQRRLGFLAQAVPTAERLLHTRLHSPVRPRGGPALRRWALETAQAVSREIIGPWLEDSEREANLAFQEAGARFTALANDLLERLAATTTWEPGALPRALEPEEGLGVVRRFSFYDFHHLVAPAGLLPALRAAADRLLPDRTLLRHVEREARGFLRQLLETNAARVENDLKQRLSESRKQVEGEIRRALGAVVLAAEAALGRARRAQAAGQDAHLEALQRVTSLRAKVAALHPPGAGSSHR